jgi:hypothetical protein
MQSWELMMPRSATKIVVTLNGATAGKLADAELHFTEGPLAGLRLVGFGVWKRREPKAIPDTGRYADLNVTFPARSYPVNNAQQRATFAVLRPQAGAPVDALDPLRLAILNAYEAERAGILACGCIGSCSGGHVPADDSAPIDTSDEHHAEDYPGQRITGPDYDTRDREGRD